ncbi:MAG TPA: transglycosylase family protein [Acidimicrobiales bacterium]|nr:transglycosylase family protein [Acidimicrobiales bacterium]
MRKHPLLAFATTTLGLGIGATTIGVSGAATSRMTHRRLNVGETKLATHGGSTGHQARSSGSGRSWLERSVILSQTGPTDFLFPRAKGLPPEIGAPPRNHIWAMLRACESGDNYRENSGNGYYGAYQFTITSWNQIGEVGFPNLATPAVQDEAAQRLMAIQGWHAWPVCSVMLGFA